MNAVADDDDDDDHGNDKGMIKAHNVDIDIYEFSR